MAQRLKRSVVWINFKKVSDSLVTCQICHRSFRFYGNTSNMKEHLKRKHFSNGDPALNVPGSVQQPATSTTLNVMVPSMPSSPTLKKNRLVKSDGGDNLTEEQISAINRALVRMLVIDFQSLSLVGEESFIALIKALKPSYNMPSEETLSNELLPALYNEILPKIQSVLSNISYLAVTIDLWKTFIDSEVFLTISAHYIDSSKRKSSVLETVELSECYTDQDISFSLSEIFFKWNINNKVIAIVSENNVKIKTAAETYLNKNHNLCVGRILSSCLDDAINANMSISSVLQNCRSLVKYIKTDTSASENLRRTQQTMGLPELSAKLEKPNRWYSRLCMLQRLVEIKQPLSVIMANSPFHIDNLDWCIIEDCIPLLETFEEVSKELSREKYPVLSLVIPLVRGMEYSLKKQNPKTESGIAFKDDLIKIVENDLGILESNPIFAKATFLDPRFKKFGFDIEKNAEMAQVWIMEEVGNLYAKRNSDVKQELKDDYDNNQTATTSNNTTTTSSLWEQFDSEVSAMITDPTNNEDIFSLVKQYLDLPLVHRSKDPFLFWEANKSVLRELYDLSLKYLCIPATSVPSTSVFSKFGQLSTERRSLLSGDCMNYIMFLNGNIDD